MDILRRMVLHAGRLSHIFHLATPEENPAYGTGNRRQDFLLNSDKKFTFDFD